MDNIDNRFEEYNELYKRFEKLAATCKYQWASHCLRVPLKNGIKCCMDTCGVNSYERKEGESFGD
jgi:hypothetical protein